MVEDLDCSMPEVKLSTLRIRPALSSSHEVGIPICRYAMRPIEILSEINIFLKKH